MPLALLALGRTLSTRSKAIRTQATPSGAYVAGGDTVDLTTITNPKLLTGVTAAANPEFGTVLNTPAGYTAELVKGATLKTWKLKVYAQGTELVAGPYPAALVADPFVLQFEGRKGNF